ncbi:Circadian clock protein kinase KaiC [Stieleria maiorica]|uniref:non-specific serine/threonine protein kinase n=1 Tax=Stieleria maiorica TaxID=2795974 RepID=A0A5B9MJY4_9BACT|nr:ATPase domain-containing protein [Stieleria maiorica]QEG01194.1 Circadian clock protein kinase KaiC [Stieleria maiorica]
MSQESRPVRSGIAGLDEVLGGGFTVDRTFLIEGEPGTGKTTLGMQFLIDGARQGEPSIYVTLSETRSELLSAAQSHGWSLHGIEIYELLDPESSFQSDLQYTMFEPAEIELAETTRGLLEQIERIRPTRIVIDSLSEFRLLAQSGLRYRRQVLALKQYFTGKNCTVLLLDDMCSEGHDLQLHSIATGVLKLDRPVTDFGRERRRLRVVKFRGRQFQSGYHDFDILRGGISVYPRIMEPATGQTAEHQSLLLSGNGGLDTLLGGGVTPGTSTLLLGPAGVGKSSCSLMFAYAAAKRGEHAILYAFDEGRSTLLSRAKGLGMDLAAFESEGLLRIEVVDPGEITPGQFAYMVRQSVKGTDTGRRTSVVIIDSLNGYLSAMPEERFLHMQMHELLSYLGGHGIATFLVVAQHGMLGAAMLTPVDASYLADTVLLFRYFEADGCVRQAISVVKKRSSNHERTIREFRMQDGKIVIGEPLSQFRGILEGTPVYHGGTADLISRKPES